jgi:hypothetical protein
MVILLFVLSLLALFVGIAILSMAKSAIHEIEAFLLFIIASLLFVGAAIIEAIRAAAEQRATGAGRTGGPDAEQDGERKRMSLDAN